MDQLNHLDEIAREAWGETIGVAVCRALVLSRLGLTVDVPDELLQAQGGLCGACGAIHAAHQNTLCAL